MKRNITFVAAAGLVAALAAPVAAQEEGFDVQSFDLAPSLSANYLTLQQARVLRAGQYEVGLVFNYANDPLVFTTDAGDRTGKIVRNLLSAHLLGAFGIGDRLEFGFDLPFILVQDSDVGGTGLFDGGSGFGVGDLRVVPKVLILGPPHRDDGVALALALDTRIPTGVRDDLQGGGFGVEPRLALDYVFGSGTRIGANLGYFIRENNVFANVEVDDALTYGVAADFVLGESGRWHLVPELRGETVVGIDGKGSEESPLELALAGKVFATDAVMIDFGGGTGLINGVGTPDFRLFGGVTYVRPIDDEPEMPAVRDDCPGQDEDYDGFEDEDGCPDPDNDGDGIPDVHDRCPDIAEDLDGFEDEDGCPDPDNDGDGVPDVHDRCPDEPEDFDGFEDGDGCPDPDNDGDGIPDADDACPDEPEDFDGDADHDGCPDRTEVTCEEIRFDGAVQFAYDSDVIDPASYALLNEIARVMNEHPEVLRVEVAGHTDARGTDEYNRDLSQRRTESVVRYLVGRGVAQARLSARGYGESMPIDTNDTDEGMARNRRVEINILERSDDCR